jgi:hypothetical protein
MAERKKILLRIPPELHAEIARLAEADLRSINAQMEILLREAVRKRRGSSDERQGRATDDE